MCTYGGAKKEEEEMEKKKKDRIFFTELGVQIYTVTFSSITRKHQRINSSLCLSILVTLSFKKEFSSCL